MKKLSFAITISLTFFIAACSEHKEAEKPKPGAVVATAEMPVAENHNNKFSIKLLSDSTGKQGVYTVDANSGPYSLTSQFTMPKGGEDFQPLIRNGSAANTFIIGFKLADDTTFYDYFEVSSKLDTIKMKYLKAYSFK